LFSSLRHEFDPLDREILERAFDAALEDDRPERFVDGSANAAFLAFSASTAAGRMEPTISSPPWDFGDD
jgi:hypothetical protein